MQGHVPQKVDRAAFGRYGIVLLLSAGVSALDVKDLLQSRTETTQAFHDGTRSPLAAVARHDFQGDRWLSFGSAEDDDARLEGVPAHALKIRALKDSFETEQDGKVTPLPAGAKARVQVGRYVLRLSHQNFPGVVVLDPQSPALKTGPFPVWFEPDPAARVEAKLVPEAQPREEIVLSTRGNKRRALRLGKLVFELQGKQLSLTALRLLEPGTGEAAVSIFFRDQTTGHESYPVGRYIDAEKLADDRYALDFNRAYNPTCAFSPLYNCPIPPRENVLSVPVRAGERDPGGH